MAKLENVDVNKVKVEIEVSKEDFAAALQQAYIKNRAKFTVQGFRKGKAPKPVIESHYGEGIFFEDAFEAVFPESYKKAVDELEIVPVSRPDVDIVKIGKKEGIIYTAEIFIKPEVKLGDYKGVKAEQVKSKVDELQVEQEISKAAEQNARWVDVDRQVQNNDKVIIDFSGSIDGEKFDGGTAENQTLEIGSKTFIPGFEEQVIGMKKQEEKDITVKFPEGYQAEQLAGKDAVFHVKLHDIKEKEMPKIDDEFAQDVSEFDTMDEYRASILKRLEEEADKKAKTETENNVIEQVVKNSMIDLPDCMIENQIDNQIKQIEYSLMYQGMKLQDYLKMTGGTMEGLRKDYRENSESAVRTQLVLEAVKNAEKIESTDEQLEEELNARAEKSKKELDEFRKSIKDEEIEYIKENLAYDNTVSFLVDNAALHAPKKKAKKDKAEKENTKGE